MAKTNHVVLMPVYGVKLGPSVPRRELRIERVTFIDRDKIPRVRRRFGLKLPIASYREKMGQVGKEFLTAPTYACLKSRRDPNDRNLDDEQRVVREAFWLLASSFFPYMRRQDATLCLRPMGNATSDTVVVETNSPTFKVNFRSNSASRLMLMDEFWQQCSKDRYFNALLRVLSGNTPVHGAWRSSLRRSAILAGQSYLAGHVAEAFFCNMVAIESLLACRGDKFPEALIERLVALFGWLTHEEIEPWRSTVKHLYQLRCSYVHDGKSGGISDLDLQTSDLLLQNLLATLCKKTKWIPDKEALIELAEQSKARMTLGMKAKWPGKVTFWGAPGGAPESSEVWAR